MFKLVIIFAGLIAHVGLDTPNLQRAVLVNVPNPKHRAILVVKKTDIVLEPTAASNEAFDVISGSPITEKWYSLEKQDVRIVGVPLGKTKTTTPFDNSVVHLKDATTGVSRKLDSKILNGNLSHGAATTFVKYDGGTIDFKSSFGFKAKFSIGVTDRCVACEVIWTSDETPSTVVDIVAESGKWVRVNSNATLEITHLPIDPEDSVHFHKFKSLLSGVTAFSTIDKTGAAMDCMPKCPNARGVTVECTATQWP